MKSPTKKGKHKNPSTLHSHQILRAKFRASVPPARQPVSKSGQQRMLRERIRSKYSMIYTFPATSNQ